MRFFLDENFPKKAVEILEAAGHEVFDIRGSVHEGADDRSIFDLAQKHGAVFLTTDKDFYHTVPRLYRAHHGIIIIALSQPNGTAILNRFKSALGLLDNLQIESNALLLTETRLYTLA